MNANSIDFMDPKERDYWAQRRVREERAEYLAAVHAEARSGDGPPGRPASPAGGFTPDWDTLGLIGQAAESAHLDEDHLDAHEMTTPNFIASRIITEYHRQLAAAGSVVVRAEDVRWVRSALIIAAEYAEEGRRNAEALDDPQDARRVAEERDHYRRLHDALRAHRPHRGP